MLTIRDDEIQTIEKILLPPACHFSKNAKEVIRCWESTDVAACPGSGKTTVLLAKLKLLADRMPLDNGAGICVLSHTNVAVNEVKEKMADYAAKLEMFPNYIGTIQSFVDKFVTRPYIKHKYGRNVQVVDNQAYAKYLLKIINSWKYKNLTGLIKYAFKNNSRQNISEIDYVSNLFLQSDGSLCIHSKKHLLLVLESHLPINFN